MSTPEVKTTTPTKPHAAKSNLFKNKYGEYSICVKRRDGRYTWLSLHTKNREDAVRRLVATGVDKVVEIMEDERFKEKVIEVLSAKKITLENVVEEWLDEAASRLHAGSIGHYNVIGKQILQVIEPTTDIKDITPQQVSAWINTAPSLTRRRRRMSVLESLFAFAFNQGHRKDNIAPRLCLKFHDLTFDQMERKVREPFTEEEFKQLLACEAIQGFWRWAIQIGWWLGIRPVDICNLQWGSFCAVPGKLVVWQQKTRRRMELDISDPVLGGGVLLTIINEIRAQATDTTYCFPEMKKLYVEHQQAIPEGFRECCIAAGLSPKKTFYSFRKSAAMRWQAAGRSIQEIGVLLGHESTGNTGYYLERANSAPGKQQPAGHLPAQ
jgi:integrase